MKIYTQEEMRALRDAYHRVSELPGSITLERYVNRAKAREELDTAYAATLKYHESIPDSLLASRAEISSLMEDDIETKREELNRLMKEAKQFNRETEKIRSLVIFGTERGINPAENDSTCNRLNAGTPMKVQMAEAIKEGDLIIPSDTGEGLRYDASLKKFPVLAVGVANETTTGPAVIEFTPLMDGAVMASCPDCGDDHNLACVVCTPKRFAYDGGK